VYERFISLRYVLGAVLLLAILISLALGWIVATQMARPLGDVTLALHELAHGLGVAPVPEQPLVELDLLSASEFVEMFVGVGASRVRDLFSQAKGSAPAIVFIDELDAVGKRRGAGLGNVNDEREQTLNQLLVEMDGFDDRHEAIVLAATNRPDVLDPALLRPGRFDRQVTLGLPDRRGREGILGIHTKDLHLAPDVDLGVLARTTTGFCGADLANLCNEAALVAARRKDHAISMDHFDEALDKVLLGGVRPLLLDEHDRRVVAYHESGHALVAWFTPAADPVHKVTIIPRGRALGVTEQLPGDDHYNYSRECLVARLAAMLGGRASEDVALGDITTGAENDLVEATRLARRMITRWAMGSVGPVALRTDDEQPFLGYEIAQGRDYSEATAARIDDDVHSLLVQRYESVVIILKVDGQNVAGLSLSEVVSHVRGPEGTHLHIALFSQNMSHDLIVALDGGCVIPDQGRAVAAGH
jgi:cell division protease FtsH